MQYFVIIMHEANTIIYLYLGSLYNNSENFLPLYELCNWFNWVKLFLGNRPAAAAAAAAAIMMPSVSLVSSAKLVSQSHPSPASSFQNMWGFYVFYPTSVDKSCVTLFSLEPSPGFFLVLSEGQVRLQAWVQHGFSLNEPGLGFLPVLYEGQVRVGWTWVSMGLALMSAVWVSCLLVLYEGQDRVKVGRGFSMGLA